MDLGWVPEKLVVHLTRGGGFRAGLEAPEPWEDGTGIALVFSPPAQDPIEWPAAIDGAVARWEMAAADVTGVLDAGVDLVVLRYTAPSLDPDVWARGHVRAY